MAASKNKENSEKMKQSLFQGAQQKAPDNFSIQSLKNINNHLRESTKIMNQYNSRVYEHLEEGTKKMEKIDGTYSGNQNSITKGKIIIKELEKRNRKNKMIVYGSFIFFLLAVVFIILRRLFFRDFYSRSWFADSIVQVPSTFEQFNPSQIELIQQGEQIQQNQQLYAFAQDGSL